jgi:uncharacterized cupin superfamily protein
VPRPINYDEIIDGLSQKTEQGKLSWKPTVDDNAFICVLEGEFTLRIVKFPYDGQERVAFSMIDKGNSEVVALSVGENDELRYRKLADLHEVARRSAFDVEGKVKKIKDILGRL